MAVHTEMVVHYQFLGRVQKNYDLLKTKQLRLCITKNQLLFEKSVYMQMFVVYQVKLVRWTREKRGSTTILTV